MYAKKLKLLVACVGMSSGVLYAINQLDRNFVDIMLTHHKVHIAQEQQADGNWRVAIYNKEPIGFYEKIAKRKNIAVYLTYVGGAVLVGSCVAANVLTSQYEGAVGVGLVVGALATVIGGAVWIEYHANMKRFEKGYIPPQDDLNKPVEKCEYYLLRAAIFQEKKPTDLFPTFSAVSYAQQQQHAKNKAAAVPVVATA